MTVTPPSNLTYGKVVWQAVSDIVDGSDPDVTPDFIAPTGTVTFVASMVAGRDISATPNPVTVVRDPITGILDEEGYLCTPGDPNVRGVWLIATDDPDLNPADWVYNVTYAIKGANNRTIPLKSHQIYVPTYEAPGDEVDLTTVGPVDNAATIGIPAAEALAAQAAASAAQAVEGLALKADKATFAGEAIRVDGDSFTDDGLVPGVVSTLDNMWFRQLADSLDADSVTTYGKSGQRINYGLNSAIASGPLPGLPNPVTGSVWDGGGASDVFADFLTNDSGHYMTLNGPPVAIAGSEGTKYKNGMAAAWDAYLHVISSASRREVVAGGSGITFSGSFTPTATTYSSGGQNTSTVTPGDYVELANVIPPQSGPYAGRVALGVLQFDSTYVGNAPISVSVDGGPAWTWTPTDWESYTENALVFASQAAIPVDVPADGAGHTVRFTHAGSAGQYMDVDAVYIMSVTPPNIYVLDCPDMIVGYFDSTAVATWKANAAIMRPIVKAVVAKHPNAVWVPTSMTAGGLAPDGVHPMDPGMEQRKNDAKSAVTAVRMLGLTAAKRAMAAD